MEGRKEWGRARGIIFAVRRITTRRFAFIGRSCASIRRMRSLIITWVLPRRWRATECRSSMSIDAPLRSDSELESVPEHRACAVRKWQPRGGNRRAAAYHSAWPEPSGVTLQSRPDLRAARYAGRSRAGDARLAAPGA